MGYMSFPVFCIREIRSASQGFSGSTRISAVLFSRGHLGTSRRFSKVSTALRTYGTVAVIGGKKLSGLAGIGFGI
jgi:hypothetical protein